MRVFRDFTRGVFGGISGQGEFEFSEQQLRERLFGGFIMDVLVVAFNVCHTLDLFDVDGCARGVGEMF